MSKPNLFTKRDLLHTNELAGFYFLKERDWKQAEKAYKEFQQDIKDLIRKRLFDSISHLYFKTNSPEDSKHYLAGCILKPVDVVVSLESPENIAIFIKVETVELGPNSYKSDLGRIWQEIPENLIPVDYEPA